MAKQLYNPLLKLGLQELQDIPEPPAPITIDDGLSPVSTNPVQNKVITAKLSEMEADTRKKITKFFTSIEELKIDETGEYQGEPGGDFVPGYFYKRQSCYINELTPPEYTWNGAGYLDIINRNGDILSRQYAREISPDGYITFSQQQVITAYCGPNAQCFLFSPSFLIADNLPICNVNGYDYYIFPYAQVRPSANEYYFDFDNPVQYLGNNKVKYADNEPYTLNRAGYNFHAWIGAEINNPSILHAWLGQTPFFSLLISSDFSKVAFDNVTPFIYGDYIYTALSETVQITAQTSTLSSQQPFVRVDTQPSLDPSTFATATQGAKADSALQGISKGTDGNYITTTVTTKDANNKQSVSASLTIQATATADSSHKGVAEASDVKSYIASNTATKAQGTTADSALQQLNKGTDGDYITTTVTPKVSNQQSVSSSLTMQAVATADTDHKGITEASDVKNYIDTGLKNLSEQVLTENYLAYGVEWSLTTGDPTCTRIGNAALHQSLPIQSAMVGGVLDDAGNFTPFDDIADWTQASQKRDGTDGQVMVYVPSFYIRFITLYDKLQVWLSQYPLTGFMQVGNFYFGAHEATLQRSTLKLSDVVSADPDYRGGNNNAAWDGTYRSLLGMPATYISLNDFRAYARNRWSNYAGNAHRYDYYKWLVWLWVVEYATLNIQTAFNSALDANGYHQGGMGPGVTTWTDTAWNNYNSHYPLVPCGTTDALGNGSGVVAHSVKDADNNTLITFNVPRWRGIENFFGHIWKWTDGVLVDFASVPNHPQIMTSSNAADFGDITKYVNIGEQATAQSYITKITYGEAGDITAKAVGGSSTSYYCDYFWFNNDFTQNTRGLLFGGHAVYGASAGAFYSSSRPVPASVGARIGSRLCYTPPAPS